jgi:hypothetical protein
VEAAPVAPVAPVDPVGPVTVEEAPVAPVNPVAPLGPTDKRVIFTVLPAFTIAVPVGSVIKFNQSPTASV